MKPFDYYNAKSINNALQLISSLKDKRVRLLARDTDLIIQMKNNFDYPQAIIHIGEIPELRLIEDLGDSLRIGAATTFSQIAESKLVKQFAPVLAQASLEVGSWQIRNRATIGGNIANASPAADSVPPLFVLNASVITQDQHQTQQIPIQDFFTGPGKTILNKEQLIIAVQFPKMKSSQRAFFEKIGQRRAMTIAKTSVAALIDLHNSTVSDARIALGAVAPTVIRAPNAESILRGKTLSPELINQAATAAAKEAKPIDDIRSSVQYRREMCRILLKRGLENFLPDET
jgi:carbon-monoxide dehydrogenase medium subunit